METKANNTIQEGISVIMPSYNQGNFISRAVESLKAQTHRNWELVVINDGSTDNTPEVMERYLSDKRVKYLSHPENKGLGYCLNLGLDNAAYSYIAYLPSDDLYGSRHLELLLGTLAENTAILAYSGIKHHYNRFAEGMIEGYTLQLVQVMHRKTEDRWLERDELVTDDLDRMFWGRLKEKGVFAATGRVSCEWVDHPDQRHKIIREPAGGINPYRAYYKVKQPLRFHSSTGALIDEVSRYSEQRERPDTPPLREGLKILLVGDLGNMPDRVLVLEELGHQLFGLWLRKPQANNNIGPVPFGHVQDISYSNWQQEIERIRPDIIYALLDWQSVPLAHEVLMNNPGIPFVWNLKESPFLCIKEGTWSKLVDLYTRSSAQIYPSGEMKEWVLSFLPWVRGSQSLVMDTDLPRKQLFTGERSPLLSALDGEIHTVVPGCPSGLHPHIVEELAKNQIHLHIYADMMQGQWKDWLEKASASGGDYLHIHPDIDAGCWTKEFSKYDAGWLNYFQSRNYREICCANWDDLNLPARLATLAMAGLPVIQGDNEGHFVASQALTGKMETGIFFRSIPELAEKLRDKALMERVREKCWNTREYFTFDHHAPTLIEFFRQVIEKYHNQEGDMKKGNATSYSLEMEKDTPFV